MAGRRGEDAAVKAAFFTAPSGVAHRQYEALRAYFVEGLSAAQAAARFGYAPSTMVAMIRDFTPQHADFFVDRRPGRRTYCDDRRRERRGAASEGQPRAVPPAGWRGTWLQADCGPPD